MGLFVLFEIFTLPIFSIFSLDTKNPKETALMQQRTEEVAAMAVETFTHTALPAVKAKYEQDGEVDGPARREEWCNHIDYLNKSGRITEYEAANIDFDVESL